MNLGKYGKFWLALVAVVGSWVTLVAKPPAHVSSHEYLILATGVVGAVVTWWIPMTRWTYGKTVGNVLTAIVGWAVIVADSKPSAITGTEWALALTMTLTAAGVYAISNAPASVLASSRVTSTRGY